MSTTTKGKEDLERSGETLDSGEFSKLLSTLTSNVESEQNRTASADKLTRFIHNSSELLSEEQTQSIVASVETTTFGAKQESVKCKSLLLLSELCNKFPNSLTSTVSDKLSNLVIKSEQKPVDRKIAIYALRTLLTAASGGNKSLENDMINKKKLISPKVLSYLLTTESLEQRLQISNDYEAFLDILVILTSKYKSQIGFQKNQSTILKLLLSTAVEALAHTDDHKGRNALLDRFYNCIPSIVPAATIVSDILPDVITYIQERKCEEENLVNDDEHTIYERRQRNTYVHARALSSLLLKITPKIPSDQIQRENFFRVVFPKFLAYSFHELVNVDGNLLLHYVFSHGADKINETKVQISYAIKSIVKSLLDMFLIEDQTYGTLLQNAVIDAMTGLLRLYAQKKKNTTTQNTETRTVQDVEREKSRNITTYTLLSEFASIMSQYIQNLSNLSVEDIEVYLFVPTSDIRVYHDVDHEMTKNPIYMQNRDSNYTKYELTAREWEEVGKQEKEIKQKNKSMNLEEIRRNLVTGYIERKEAETKKKISSIEMRLIALLSGLGRLFGTKYHPVRYLLHKYMSYIVFPIASSMKLELTDDLAEQSYLAYKSLCQNLCTDFIPYGLACTLAHATFRLIQPSLYTGELFQERGRLFEFDDDIVYAEKVISMLRSSTIGKTVDAETFSVVLVFLQSVLHRHIIKLKGQKKQKISDTSLTIAMSLLSAHVGMEDIRSGTVRPESCKILIEVLTSFPSLNKQATNALLSLAHYLLPIDLDPLLDGLFSDRSNVRETILRTLQQYPPLTPEYESGHQFDTSMYQPENEKMLHSLYFAMHDSYEERNTIIAKKLWNTFRDRNLEQQPTSSWGADIQEKLFTLLTSSEEYVRQTAAISLSSICELLGERTDILKILEKLFDIYKNSDDSGKMGAANALGSIAKLLSKEEHLKAVFHFLAEEGLRNDNVKDAMVEAGLEVVNRQAESQKDSLLKIFKDYLKRADSKRIEDKQQQQQQQQQKTSQAKGKAKKNVKIIMESKPATKPAAESKHSKASDDYVVGTFVLYMGTLSRGFSLSEQDKILDTIDRLIVTLSIPSATVQRSVSKSLTALVSKFRYMEEKRQNEIFEPIFTKLITKLIQSDSTYGERKGMAFGIGGLIEGLGIGSIKRYHILAILNAAYKKKESSSLFFKELDENAGTAYAKEGVLIGYDTMADVLNDTFEPYIVEIIPLVLEGVNDSSSAHVRQAAEDCLAILMKKMSGHGVRMLLPTVLTNTSYEGQNVKVIGDGRTKVASVQLLGAMAYCSPRQLSEYLPVVVKALYEEALNDTLPQVQQNSMKALERVGSAVQNPEIAQAVPEILHAITNPTTKEIDKVLESLLFTRFVHSIDAPSLALLVPLMIRGLKERHSETRRKAATIVGSISALTTRPSDLLPYIPELVPLLQQCVIDPQPKVRQAGAKSVGTLAKSLGEQKLSKMIEWVQHNLEKKDNPVERAGAAQAISEIVAAQGPAKLQQMLPSLLEKVSSSQTQIHIRHGYMQIFIYLPALMKSQFEQFLPVCLPKILEGLSDMDEMVRETALSSSKVMVEIFASSAIDMLVPSLKEGMKSAEWRIRQSSLMLLSDFLIRISQEYEEKNPSFKKKEESKKTVFLDDVDRNVNIEVLKLLLGNQVLDEILSLLFVLQNDAHTSIKSKANELWSLVVFHTPKQLRSMIHTLLNLIISLLACENEELKEQAARSLGELIMKIGEKVIGEAIPILSEGLNDNASLETRQGVCMGLRELLYHANEKHVSAHQKNLISFVKRAVCDPEPVVQQAGAETFDGLFRILGFKVINEMLENLLSGIKKELAQGPTSITLNGLQQLIKVRGQHLLSKLMPMLIGEDEDDLQEINEIDSKIIGASVQVAGPHLTGYLSRLLNLWIKLVGESICDKKPNLETYIDALLKTMASVSAEDMSDVVEMLAQELQSSIIPIRVGACQAAQSLFDARQQAQKQTGKRSDEEEQIEQEFKEKAVPILLEALLKLYNDPAEQVVKQSHKALLALFGPNATIIKNDELPEYIGVVRETIRMLTEDDQSNRIIPELIGFNQPGGLDSLLQMFLQGLMFGKTVEIREQAAIGLGDLIELTNAKFLTKYVIKITGPLIRIVGDRFPWQVKAAILQTMKSLLEKSGPLLKPFFPQLQTTFIKSLQDPNIQVRSLAAVSLGKLVPLSGPRIDGLVNEIHNAIKTLLTQKKNAIVFDTQTQGTLISLLQAIEAVFITPSNPKSYKNPLVAAVKQATLEQFIETLLDLLDHLCSSSFTMEPSNIDLRTAAAARVPILMKYISDEKKFTDIMDSHILEEARLDNKLQAHGLMLALGSMVEVCPERILSKAKLDQMLNFIEKEASMKSSAPTKKATFTVASNLLSIPDEKIMILESREKLVQIISTGLSNPDNQVRYDTVTLMRKLSKKIPSKFREILLPWVQPLLQCVKDKNFPVKLASERCLIAVLHMTEGNQLLKQFIQKFIKEKDEAKSIVDYCQKVLTKLAEENEESDEENE